MKRKTLVSVLTFACGFSLCAALAAADEWGTLKGKFVFDGKPPAPVKVDTKGIQTKEPVYEDQLIVGPDGGIANIVIYVRTKGVKVHPDYASSDKDKVVLDNKDFRFFPRIATLRLTQTLVFANSADPASHNSNYQPIGDTPANPLIPTGGTVEYTASRAQNIPQQVNCNIHPWMRGYVVVRDNPYMAVTAPDGTFEIKNLPVGDLEFQFWHEKAGYLNALPSWNTGRVTIKIKPGENLLEGGTVKCKPELFNKAS